MRYTLVLGSALLLLVACGRDDDTTMKSVTESTAKSEKTTNTSSSVVKIVNEQTTMLLDSTVDTGKKLVQDTNSAGRMILINEQTSEAMIGNASAAIVKMKDIEDTRKNPEMEPLPISDDNAIISVGTREYNSATMKETEIVGQQPEEISGADGMTKKALNELILQLSNTLQSLEQSAGDAKQAARALKQGVQE